MADPNPEGQPQIQETQETPQGAGQGSGEPAEAPQPAPGIDPNRLQLKKVMTTATWAYNVEVENCAICKNYIVDHCIDCQAGNKAVSEECPVVFGVCNHGFHLHCITRWLLTRQVCPLDNRRWEFLSYRQ